MNIDAFLNIDAVLNFAKAALTPIVAVLALYVAYRQYRTEQHSTKIELFNRRFDVYRRTLNYVLVRDQSDTIPEDINRAFFAAKVEAEFLFGKDVQHALAEIQRRGVGIDVANSMRSNKPPEEEIKYVYTMREHQRWFTDAKHHLKKVFAKYLSVGTMRS